MAFPWISQAQLEARVGTLTVQRVTDDDDDGVADSGVVDEILADACSYIGGAMGPQYDVDAIAAMATVPREIVRLSLDIATVYAAQRYPEVVRRDWEPLLQAVERECARIRKGQANLGVAATPPEPPDQNGGDFFLEGYGSDDDSQPTTFTRDGFGGF